MSPDEDAALPQPCVEQNPQAVLLYRIAIYGVACISYFAITLVCTQWMSEPERGLMETILKSAEDVAYWLPGFLVIVPIAAHDFLKLSTAVFKPVYQVQVEMARLIDGQSERPLVADNQEHWSGLVTTFNQARGEFLLMQRRLDDQAREAELANCVANLIGDDDEPDDSDDSTETTETSETADDDSEKPASPPTTDDANENSESEPAELATSVSQ